MLRAVTDANPDAVFVLDRDGRYLLVNAAMARALGLTPEQVVGRHYADLFAPAAVRRIAERNRRVLDHGEDATYEDTFEVGGVTRHLLTTCAPYRDARGDIVGVVGVARDVTDQARLAAERDALLARLRLHVDRMPLAYVLLDADLRVADWNPAAERIFGYPKAEVLGMGPPFEKILPPAARLQAEGVLRRLQEGDMTAHAVNDNLTRDGRVITCEWFNTPLFAGGRFAGILGLARDVTDERRLEEQYRQAQKMEAVGRLAGGVAHDFNNLLTVINGYSDMLLQASAAGDPSRELLEEIRQAGERSAGLTRQLLAFSRQQPLAPRLLDLGTVVTDTEKMLRRLIGEDVRLKTRLVPGLWPVRADRGQLEQVLLNLAVNARDAMPTGGTLTIETRNVVLGEDAPAAHPDARPGPHVLLSVSDTGCGMTDEVRARVFEPFFTTKGPGKGTGLGLATVYGIIRQFGGHVAVKSAAGVGSTFAVYLPRADGADGSDKARSWVLVPPRGTETVLLVEDDAGVRALSRRVLAGCGYTVLEAADGHEAVRAAERHPGPVHLVVADVVMPGTGGRAAVERVARRWPGVRVLYVSGHTEDAVVRHGVESGRTDFLQKPFAPAVLAAKVREVLDRLG